MIAGPPVATAVASPKPQHSKPGTAGAAPAAAATGAGFIQSALSAPVTAAEAALRPLAFTDFAGQTKTVERLKVMVHVLLLRPPLEALHARVQKVVQRQRLRLHADLTGF